MATDRPILPKLFVDYFFEESGSADHFLNKNPQHFGPTSRLK